MTLGLIGLAQLSVASIRLNHVALQTTMATGLATQKVQVLKTLSWAFDPAGTAVSDTTTDTTVTPDQPAGGTGLTPSPPDALLQNTSGYVDFLDEFGRALGGGPAPPTGAAYVRRWSIDPLDLPDTIVLQVSVTALAGGGGGPSVRRRPEEARFVVVKTRKSG